MQDIATGPVCEKQNRQYELHKMGPTGDIESRPAVSTRLKEGERSLKYELLH